MYKTDYGGGGGGKNVQKIDYVICERPLIKSYLTMTTKKVTKVNPYSLREESRLWGRQTGTIFAYLGRV